MSPIRGVVAMGAADSQARQSASARAVIACFLASALSLPRSRWPPAGRVTVDRREQAEIDIHRLEGALARFVVGDDVAAGDMVEQRAEGRGRRRQARAAWPSRSAAAKRPASRPMAALST